jgi:hypothetical protein
MSVIAENLTIQQGETFSKDFILKNPDQSLIGISSYTSTGFLAKYAGDTTTYPFIVGLTTSTSTIRISLASTITSTLDAGRYYYNVFTVNGSSVKEKQREGNVLVNASVLS